MAFSSPVSLHFFCFVDGCLNGVGALRGGEDALYPGEILRRFKDLRLLYGGGLHQPVVVELGQGGAHAVVAQAAGVVGGRG